MPLYSFRKAIFIYFLGLFGLCLSPLLGKGQSDSLKSLPVEKLPVAIKSPANIRPILVLPIIARSIETGWSFGIASAGTFHLYKRDTAIRTSNAQALALYTTRKQFVTALNGSIYFPGERFIINEQLSHRQKEIIYLKYYQDLSYEEVGEIMNINYQVARNLLYQAMKSLRKYITILLLLALFSPIS